MTEKGWQWQTRHEIGGETLQEVLGIERFAKCEIYAKTAKIAMAFDGFYLFKVFFNGNAEWSKLLVFGGRICEMKLLEKCRK